MLYLVKDEVSAPFLVNLLSDYQNKFGMNILCDDHIKHLGLWLHDQVMIRHFCVSDNSDTLMLTSDMVSCEGECRDEFHEICDLVQSALETVGGVSKLDEVSKFTEYFEVKLYWYLCRKVRYLINEALNQWYEMVEVDVSSSRAIRELCSSINDSLDYYTKHP